jgi:hypothetical protein
MSLDLPGDAMDFTLGDLARSTTSSSGLTDKECCMLGATI